MQLMELSRDWVCFDCCGIAWISTNSITGDNVSQIGDFFLKEETFGWFNLQLSILESAEHTT